MAAQRSSVWLGAVAAGIIAAAPAHVRCETSSDPAEYPRAVVFTPDRPERCDYFFVTEFNVSVTGLKSQDALNRYLFTDALGVMRSIDRTRAVGLSVDTHLSAGAIRFAPTVRFKQWLAGQRSLDLSLGYAYTPIEQEGVVGPIVDVRYSPAAWFHIQAGACRIRDVGYVGDYPNFHIAEHSELQLHAGAGVGGVPGAISWGVQALGFVGLAVAFSGWE